MSNEPEKPDEIHGQDTLDAKGNARRLLLKLAAMAYLAPVIQTVAASESGAPGDYQQRTSCPPIRITTY